LFFFPQATLEASDRAKALKEKQEAQEAARLSQLISEDVRRKEEVRLERERREREREEELDNSFIEVGPNGEREVSVSLRIDGENTDGMVKFGLASSGGAFPCIFLSRSHFADEISPDWLGRIFPVEISRKNKPLEAGSAYVFDVLGPYFLTSQGASSSLRLHSPKQTLTLCVQASENSARSKPTSTGSTLFDIRTYSPFSAIE
jgi:translation initiation factor 2-alpha kinase 4